MIRIPLAIAGLIALIPPFTPVGIILLLFALLLGIRKNGRRSVKLQRQAVAVQQRQARLQQRVVS